MVEALLGFEYEALCLSRLLAESLACIKCDGGAEIVFGVRHSMLTAWRAPMVYISPHIQVGSTILLRCSIVLFPLTLVDPFSKISEP